MSLLVGLLESSGGLIRSFPPSISFHHGSPFSCITSGMNNRPVGSRSSETYSHPIGIIIKSSLITPYKRAFASLKCWLEDNIKMERNDVSCDDVNLSQDVHRRNLLNLVRTSNKTHATGIIHNNEFGLMLNLSKINQILRNLYLWNYFLNEKYIL
jgi:hypothetical protein